MALHMPQFYRVPSVGFPPREHVRDAASRNIIPHAMLLPLLVQQILSVQFLPFLDFTMVTETFLHFLTKTPCLCDYCPNYFLF